MLIIRRIFFFYVNIPSGRETKPNRERVSMEVINAEAVTVWYGCNESIQALNSVGDLSYISHNGKRKNEC